MTAPKLTVHEAISKVADLVGAVGKGEQATGGARYAYRGIEALTNALAGPMHETGLLLVPHVVEHTAEPMAGRKVGWTMTKVVVEYDVYGPAGDSLARPVRSVGYGANNEDKGPGIAMSYAYKSAVGQLFCIPTDTAVDAEASAIPEAIEAVEMLNAKQKSDISALFDVIDDETQRRVVKVDWVKTLPYSLEFTAAADFDEVYVSAMDALEARVLELKPEEVEAP